MTTICQETDLTRWEGHDNITFMFFFFWLLEKDLLFVLHSLSLSSHNFFLSNQFFFPFSVFVQVEDREESCYYICLLLCHNGR